MKYDVTEHGLKPLGNAFDNSMPMLALLSTLRGLGGRNELYFPGTLDGEDYRFSALLPGLPIYGENDSLQVDYRADIGVSITALNRTEWTATGVWQSQPWHVPGPGGNAPILRAHPTDPNLCRVSLGTVVGINAPKGEMRPGQKFQLCEIRSVNPDQYDDGPYAVYAVDKTNNTVDIGPLTFIGETTLSRFRGSTTYRPRINGFEVQRLDIDGSTAIEINVIDPGNWDRAEDDPLYTGSWQEQQRTYPQIERMNFLTSPSYSPACIRCDCVLQQGFNCYIRGCSMNGNSPAGTNFPLVLVDVPDKIKPQQDSEDYNNTGMDRSGLQNIDIENCSGGTFACFRGRARNVVIHSGVWAGTSFIPVYDFVRSGNVHIDMASLEGQQETPAQISYKTCRTCSIANMGPGSPVQKGDDKIFGDGVRFDGCGDCWISNLTARPGANQWKKRTDPELCDNPGENFLVNIINSDRIKCDDVFSDAPDIERLTMILRIDDYSLDHDCYINGFFAKSTSAGIQWTPYRYDCHDRTPVELEPNPCDRVLASHS